MRSAVLILGLTFLAPSAHAADRPLKDWSVDDFVKQGSVVAPGGERHEQFAEQGLQWPTLFDFRRSKFFANESGPFPAGKAAPAKWPSPEELKAVEETSNEEKYPISLKSPGPGIYVRGGSVVGVQPRELPWRLMKSKYDGDAVRLETSGEMVVEGLYAENIEDVVSPRGGGFWTVRGCYGKYIRDDFVENDGLLSGEILDCLVDGAHVLVSNRPGKQAAARAVAEKSANPPQVVIRDTLAYLYAQPYDGDMKLADQNYIVDGKAGGKLFKWSPAGGTIDAENCVFRLDGLSASGSSGMDFPAGTYRNVTLIWLGEGDYPKPVPAGVTVSRDATVWDRARTAWLEKHGFSE